MISYLENIINEEPHKELLQLTDDTKKSIYNDIKTFNMSEEAIQSAISDISNYWIKASGTIENRIRYFFSRITKTETSSDDDLLQKKLFALQILYGLITKSRSSSAGMLFESYVAGTIGSKKRVKMPDNEQSPADLEIGDNWINIKLYSANGYIKIKNSTINLINHKNNIFVFGFKGVKNLEIYVFDGNDLIDNAYNAGTDLKLSLATVKKMVNNPVIIDFETVINKLITARVSPSLQLIRQTSDFLTEIGDVFSKKSKTYDKSKTMHKDIGKTLKEVI